MMKEYQIVFNDMTFSNKFNSYLVIMKTNIKKEEEAFAQELQEIQDVLCNIGLIRQGEDGVKQILSEFKKRYPDLRYTMISLAGVCYGTSSKC